MKAKSSSETPVNSYQTTQSHIPESSNRQSNRRDNLKFLALYYPMENNYGIHNATRLSLNGKWINLITTEKWRLQHWP